MRYCVGAEGATEVPRGDGGRVTVPHGAVHAVDPDTGEAACGATGALVVFQWDWSTRAALTRCPACAALAPVAGAD